MFLLILYCSEDWYHVRVCRWHSRMWAAHYSVWRVTCEVRILFPAHSELFKRIPLDLVNYLEIRMKEVISKSANTYGNVDEMERGWIKSVFNEKVTCGGRASGQFARHHMKCLHSATLTNCLLKRQGKLFKTLTNFAHTISDSLLV